MKVSVSIVCAVIFTVVFFSSCNKNNESIVGRWELQSVVRERMSNANPSDVHIDTIDISNISLNIMRFKKKGTALFTGIDVAENKVTYNESYDWSISEDNKMLYLENGKDANGEDLANREIEILSLYGKHLVIKSKDIEKDSTFISTNTYKRK